MSDGKMSMLFFEIGLVLTLVSCVLGPCGIQDWSIACAVVAGFLALGGIYLAFGSWTEEEPTENRHPGKNPVSLQKKTRVRTLDKYPKRPSGPTERECEHEEKIREKRGQIFLGKMYLVGDILYPAAFCNCHQCNHVFCSGGSGSRKSLC